MAYFNVDSSYVIVCMILLCCFYFLNCLDQVSEKVTYFLNKYRYSSWIISWMSIIVQSSSVIKCV